MIRMLHAQTVQLWLTHAAPLLRWSTALCGLLLIAACAQLPPAPAVNSAALTQQQSLPPLAYYAWVLQAPASEIAAEQERLALPATTAPAFINAVQRSMLLGFAA